MYIIPLTTEHNELLLLSDELFVLNDKFIGLELIRHQPVQLSHYSEIKVNKSRKIRPLCPMNIAWKSFSG